MTVATLPKTELLRAEFQNRSVGVDRVSNVIRGMVLAQAGDFKSKGRGAFDLDGLRKIVELSASDPKGLKSRFAHPNPISDGLGKFLGRIKNVRLDSVGVLRNGVQTRLDAVRGDLFLDSTSLDPPPGGGTPLGTYLMNLADSDPSAVSSSLALQADQRYRRDARGNLLLDAEQKPLPPLWTPTDVIACDIVDRGEAVDGLLSAADVCDDLTDAEIAYAKKVSTKPRQLSTPRTITAPDPLDNYRESRQSEILSRSDQRGLLSQLIWLRQTKGHKLSQAGFGHVLRQLSVTIAKDHGATIQELREAELAVKFALDAANSFR